MNDGVSNISDLSQEWLKETTQHVESIIYLTDAKGGKFYYITEAVKKVLGLTPGEVASNGYGILRRILPEDIPKFKQFVKVVQNGKNSVVEYQFKDKDDNIRWLRHTGVPIYEDGELARIAGVISDVTEEKELLDKLERSEERFRLLVETANDMIFALNKHGYFVMINESGALSLGYKPNEITGKHFLEFVDENNKSEIALAFQKILNTHANTSFEVEFVDKLGQKVIFDIQARSTLSNGDLSGVLGVGRDITGRRKDENKLKELNTKLIEANRIISIERDRAKQQITMLEELNKLKNRFISNVSHELRTPLASIVGFAETLSSDEELPEEMVKEFNNIILTEGKRLAKFINDLLDFSKLEQDEALSKTDFDLIKLLHELVNNFTSIAEEKEITISREIPEAEIIINADKERISKAFNHLLANAFKFTDADGRVTVIAQDFLKEVEVIISDTGVGIPEEDLPYLFEKFHKINRPGAQIHGAGFGLSISKKIIDLHKGFIKATSEVNRGTTFVVRLPKQ